MIIALLINFVAGALAFSLIKNYRGRRNCACHGMRKVTFYADGTSVAGNGDPNKVVFTRLKCPNHHRIL